MNTIVKSSHGITLIPVTSKLLAERKIFIEDEITPASACETVRALMLLVKEDPDKPIDIYINSPGGRVDAGLMIYDTLKGMKTEVNLHCIGMAASMAAVILAGGKKGHRFILPHSKTMIHEPLISGGVGGSATSIQRTAESIMETKRLTVELLAKDTGKKEKDIESAVAFDNYMNAEEAIAFGICDSIEYELV
ncbi:MAG: ATP-dependent Clp protease proteolytic subunit [Clostridia bacterium]|nr:ATP-dependent Clp protease proteolytic subunit [Clostridia bacterium]